jgi:hypothetical protein
VIYECDMSEWWCECDDYDVMMMTMILRYSFVSSEKSPVRVLVS